MFDVCSPDQALKAALEAARAFRGATTPNPPVGAVGLDPLGRIVAVAAHERAGGFHAERALLDACERAGTTHRLHTLVVTLEPCTHIGRTPPCTEAIRHSPIRRVFVGALDPNPVNTGRGIARLRDLGLEVEHESLSPALRAECEALIEPFRRHILGLRPYLTVKTARTADGSMIPPPGQKTFTSRDSLVLAHELRKRADAILTGSGTVLADNPLFTVRHVNDFEGKSRVLLILDRRRRVNSSYIDAATARGFQVQICDTIEQALAVAKQNQCMEVLLEAGPSVTEAVLESGLWDEHVDIQVARDSTQKDIVTVRRPDLAPKREAVPAPLRTQTLPAAGQPAAAQEERA